MKKQRKNLNRPPAVKDEGNNQWTSAHLKSVPDKRKRSDGPGGN